MSPYVLPDLNMERCQVTIDRHASKSRDSCNVSQISQPAVKLWNRSSVQYTFYLFPLHTHTLALWILEGFTCGLHSLDCPWQQCLLWSHCLSFYSQLVRMALVCYGSLESTVYWPWPFLYTGAAYCIAWMLYLRMAQTDAKFNLPLNPSRVYKANVAFIQLLVGWITDMPLIVTYLQWRWHVRKDFSQLIK